METMLWEDGSSDKHSFLLFIKETSGLSPPHLGGPAGGVRAHGAGHQHLRVHRLTLLQVIGHQVRQALDEYGIGVRGRASRDPLSTNFSAQLFSILNVQLMQGLNV